MTLGRKLMKRWITIIAYGVFTTAMAEEIDSTAIYDKLDASRYNIKNPITEKPFLPEDQTTLATGAVMRSSSTNYVRIRDGQMIIDLQNITAPEAINIYHVLGGTNAFDDLDTTTVKKLSIKVGYTSETSALNILEEQIVNNQEEDQPQQGASVVSSKFFAYSADLAKDGGSRRRPTKRLGALVVVGDVVFHGPLQVGDAFEDAPADAFLGDAGKEALHLIEPTAVGGSEMKLPAGVSSQPVLHRFSLMGGVVVQNDVHLQPCGNLPLNVTQKAQEFLGAMLGLNGADDVAGGHI